MGRTLVPLPLGQDQENGNGLTSLTNESLKVEENDTPSTSTSSPTNNTNGSGSAIETLGSSSGTPGSGSTRTTAYKYNKMFVGGISQHTTVAKLLDYFSQYGTVTDIHIIVDPFTHKNRGFGFVTFSDATTVQQLISLPRSHHILDGKRIEVKQAVPKSPTGINNAKNSRCKKVFIGGVSQATSLNEVTQYFSNFGKVEDARLLMDQLTNRHRGFGFVTFNDEKVAHHVCQIHYHTINGKVVECKIAKPATSLSHGHGLPLSSVLKGAGMSPIQAAAGSASTAVTNYVTNHLGTGAGTVGTGLAHPSLSTYRYSPYNVPPPNIPLLPSPPSYDCTLPVPGSIDTPPGVDLDWISVYNAMFNRQYFYR